MCLRATSMLTQHNFSWVCGLFFRQFVLWLMCWLEKVLSVLSQRKIGLLCLHALSFRLPFASHVFCCPPQPALRARSFHCERQASCGSVIIVIDIINFVETTHYAPSVSPASSRVENNHESMQLGAAYITGYITPASKCPNSSSQRRFSKRWSDRFPVRLEVNWGGLSTVLLTRASWRARACIALPLNKRLKVRKIWRWIESMIKADFLGSFICFYIAGGRNLPPE